MKIALYSPYLDTAGGGEKYMLSAACVLTRVGKVDILLDRHLISIGVNNIKDRLVRFHNLDLSKVQFIKAPVGPGSSFLSRLIFLRKYDLLIYLTDGSIFLSTAKRGYIHFQVPFTKKLDLWSKMKLRTWSGAIYNSKFTKKFISQNWSIPGSVIYPPVDILEMKPSKKKQYILNVGRFFGFTQIKKQLFLIRTFIDIYKSGKIKQWSLHLAGSVTKGDQAYLGELKKIAHGYPIYFYPNLAYDKLLKLYSDSSIYWHATGFNETDPSLMEHFGITTVEAMASSCVPVVINKGGQPEIVTGELTNLLWDEPDQLKSKTLDLIFNPKLRENLSKIAQYQAKNFSEKKFATQILNLVYER